MRTAIIGLGRMGRRHVQIARTLGLPIIGVYDADPRTSREAAAETGIPSSCLFTEPAALFDEGRPECVMVATTAPSHCDYTCRAAEMGARYVICEKPMATSIAQCNRMIETCQRHGTALAVNHPQRYMEQFTLPKKLLYSDEIGGVTSINVVAGDIGLAMNGTHFFEMLRFMTGEVPAEVTSWLTPQGAPNPRGEQYDDRAGQLRITTAGGKRFYLDAGCNQGHGIRVTYAGPHGQITVDGLAGTVTVSARREENRSMPSTCYGTPWVERTLRIEPTDVLEPSLAVIRDLLAGGEYPNGSDGRLVVATLVAAYVSHELGHKPVAVDLERLPQARMFHWA